MLGLAGQKSAPAARLPALAAGRYNRRSPPEAIVSTAATSANGTNPIEPLMDVLGLTFAQLCAAVDAKPHNLKQVRNSYKALLRGADPAVPAAPGLPDQHFLTADVRPIVRTVHDGHLTKFVQRLPDGLETESVVVPMLRTGGIWKTLCVSCQVGCARGCVFCETAQLGLLRNLTASEIVGQVVAARRDFGQRIRNVVFMGMGEPFDNFDNVVQAVRVLTDSHGLSFSQERVTISTVGRVSGIRRLAELGWRRVNLAVSLNAPNDAIRSRIMPVNRREPMRELRGALEAYPLRKCQFFMVAYVLIPGVNDAPEHAREVAAYLHGLPSMVNVIPYNPRGDSPWPAPSEEAVETFLRHLEAAGQGCKRRITKGCSQMAACGQLGNRALARGKPRAIG